MLGLLESAERDSGQTQRRLASQLDIALGLVNSHLKPCICAMNDADRGVVDPNLKHTRFVDLPVRHQYEQLACEFDAVLITDLNASEDTYADAIKRSGADRILAPSFLALSARVAPAEIAQ
jgi:hypothetical protein